MQISDDVIEHLRELRRLAYKDTRTLKCRQRKKRNGPKQEVWYWTGDEVKKLCDLARVGLSDEEIGKAIGRSWTAVRSKRYELGITIRNKQSLFNDDWINFIASSSSAGLNKADEWLKLSKNMERKLHKGMKYIIKPKTGTTSENVRSMYFDSVIYNTKRQPMFIFRSKAGYLESFTIQQMQDYIFEADRK